MSKEEDDQDDSANIGVGRYPCMPSLVALQQMKNRLHLAYLGKKLMKWTALATGRELRMIAINLNEKYLDFSKELADAFMLLARCRYYYRDLNKIVLEDVQKSANIVTESTVKTVSAGVKVYQFEVRERNVPAYPYLGIEKGGQTILEAKIAWENLLKKMIMILQLRDSFSSLEYAHKSATKRMNVLSKLVIPRTTATIHYILSELEEKEREEYFRMKKILQVKDKIKRAKEADLDRRENRCQKCKAPLPEGTTSGLCNKCERESAVPEQLSAKLPPPPPKTSKISEISDDEHPLSPPKTSEIFELSEVELPFSPPNIIHSQAGSEITPSPIQPSSATLPCISCTSNLADAAVIRITSRTKPLTSTCSELTCISKSSIVLEPLEKEKPLDLGVIETEVSILTRILRTRNRDGTITEQKEVIKVKKKRREPGEVTSRSQSIISFMTSRSNQSSKSSHNSYHDDKTVGTVFVINQRPPFKSKSDSVISSKPMRNISSKYCLSMMNITTSDLKDFDAEIPEVFSPCKIYVTFGTKPISLHELGSSCLTDSEMQLILNSSSTEKKAFCSDSENDLKKRFDNSNNQISYKSLHERLNL